MNLPELGLRIAETAASATGLVAYRSAALELLREVVRYDAALFHALSPRVPLATAALVGLDVARVSGSQSSWDDLAVELGALREVANRERVASLDQVLRVGSKAHTSIERHLQTLFAMRSLCIVHLAVREQIGSVVVLLAKRTSAFDDEVLSQLRALAPVLAIGDRVQEHLDGAPRATTPVRLRCEDQRLTERQREIVERVALGHSNEQIAVGTGLSANTVRNHLARIFTRLGAANRADLVRLAVLRPAPQGAGHT